MATPFALVRLGTVPSTQDEARSRYRGTPLLVTAARQTAGRGRGGSDWQTADRAVAASMAFLPAWPAASWPLISAVAGLAALDVIGTRAMLKWPNDVVVGESKVAGILVESDGESLVAGLGINLWWPDPMLGADALHRHDPGPDEGPKLAEEWARRLLERVERRPDDWGRDEYLVRSATVGDTVTWEPDGAGRAIGIAALGGLIVETEGGIVVLDSGAVHTVRGSGGRPSAG